MFIMEFAGNAGYHTMELYRLRGMSLKTSASVMSLAVGGQEMLSYIALFKHLGTA